MDDANKDLTQVSFFLGLDVQIQRPCTYYALDRDLAYVDSGLLEGETIDSISQGLRFLLQNLSGWGFGDIAIGIDAPRVGLPAPRQWYWREGAWVRKTGRERGYGRHCEVCVKALGLGSPQWTRLATDSPPWMQLGYQLFEVLEGIALTYEVFPSAAYLMLDAGGHPTIPLVLKDFAGRRKDMLDACAAAYTVWALHRGRGTEVGGGDGLGAIALPEKLPVPASHPVLHWPEA
jgi:hypothetical protein